MRLLKMVFVIACIFISSVAFAAVPEFLTIAGGPVGGEWYILAGTLADLLQKELPNTKINVTTGGAIANLTNVQRGKADIATTQDQLLYAARNKMDAFKDLEPHEDVMGVAYLAEIYMAVFLVRDDYKLDSIKEIAEKKLPIRIVTAPKGSSPSLATERLLSEYGITPESLSQAGGRISYVPYAEAASLIADGHADAYCGPIMPAIIELSLKRKLRVIPADESVLKALREKYKYGIAKIPGGSYDFIPKDVVTITETPILVANKKLDESVVYKLVKVMAENPDRIRAVGATYAKFKPEDMPNIVGGPIHPGALKYYTEKGWIKK
ncbi:MAG: TAXI family TRAP transporter solute-binding subunit [Synergistetes bacterium]|nr:TAXI family TRAP transporter solute-binding subunit [Synergistota bacterium]MDW8191680.1 TAXI family TRAP transporter solute-binding subunit [Synergistota bacterium]